MLFRSRRGVEGADYLNDLMPLLKGLKSLSEKEAAANGNVLADMLERQKEAKKKAADSLRMANALSEGDKRKCRKTIRFLEEAKKELYVGDAGTATEAFSYIKQKFDQQVSVMKSGVAETKGRIHRLFEFVKETFGEENEMLILVTELTVNTSGARFIGMFGSEDYQRYNGKLRLSGRQEDLRQEIERLEL